MGYGKVLLMLHGYLSQKESFYFQINFFSRFMRVVAVDMTGFGKAKQMEYPYSVDDYVKEIRNLLDEIGEDKVDLLAHSFGGRVGVKLANVDHRIDRIIFTGAAGLKPKRGLKFLFRKASFFILKKFIPKEKLAFLYSQDYRKLNPVMKMSFQKIVGENLDEEYKNIKNKTLIIFGKKDNQTPPYMAKLMRKLVCASRLVFIAKAGHFCFSEKPDEFNRIAWEFLMGDS